MKSMVFGDIAHVFQDLQGAISADLNADGTDDLFGFNHGTTNKNMYLATASGHRGTDWTKNDAELLPTNDLNGDGVRDLLTSVTVGYVTGQLGEFSAVSGLDGRVIWSQSRLNGYVIPIGDLFHR